jgi:hypothetical protein
MSLLVSPPIIVWGKKANRSTLAQGKTSAKPFVQGMFVSGFKVDARNAPLLTAGCGNQLLASTGRGVGDSHVVAAS